MPKYLAIVLACAVVVMMAGFYLMAPSLGPYDLSAADEKLAAQDTSVTEPKEKNLLGMFMATLQSELEVARKQQLGEYLPKTPEGWKIEKTHHDELVKFTLDYKLKLTINDKSSMRRLSGAGGAQMSPTADVKFVRDDKVVFLRLATRKVTREDPIKATRARLFIGGDGAERGILLGGLEWTQIDYPEVELINAFARVGHDTAIGVLTNASVEEVETLLSGMDLDEFGALRGRTKDGKPVSGGNLAGDGSTDAGDTMVTANAPDPNHNFADGNSARGWDDEEEEPQGAQRSKPVNLLDAIKARAGKDDGPKINRARSNGGSGGGSFQRKAGTFGANCSKSNGAKFCSAGN